MSISTVTVRGEAPQRVLHEDEADLVARLLLELIAILGWKRNAPLGVDRNGLRPSQVHIQLPSGFATGVPV